jgi:hypothetical protein
LLFHPFVTLEIIQNRMRLPINERPFTKYVWKK